MMFRSNMGFAESLVWEALRQLAVAWPRLKMATMAFFNRLLRDNFRNWFAAWQGVAKHAPENRQAIVAQVRKMTVSCQDTSRRRPVDARRAAVVTVCLAAIAILAGSYWWYATRLPDPATADREGLVRWLVLRDLDREPAEIRQVLATRFESELAQEFDVSNVRNKLSPQQRERLWANVLVLVEQWYMDHVEGYFACDSAASGAYLDGIIDVIERWKPLASLAPPGEAEPTESGGEEQKFLELLDAQLAQWKEAAPPSQREKIEQFDAALRTRWMLRTLGLAA